MSRGSLVPTTRLEKPSTAADWFMSRAMPWGRPSAMSIRQISGARSLSAARGMRQERSPRLVSLSTKVSSWVRAARMLWSVIAVPPSFRLSSLVQRASGARLRSVMLRIPERSRVRSPERSASIMLHSHR